MPCGQLGRPVQAWTSLHLADLARPEDLAGHARRIVRITLIAHLRRDLVLLRGLRRAGAPPTACASAASRRTRACPVCMQAGRRSRACGRACRSRPRRCPCPLCRASARKSLYFVGLREASKLSLAAHPIDVRQRDHVLDPRMRLPQVGGGCPPPRSPRDSASRSATYSPAAFSEVWPNPPRGTAPASRVP